MDLPTSPTTPLGPMTRARARAIENEVNSLLVELPFDPLETWLLPQTEMLCVLRYQESNQGEVTTQDEHQEHGDHLPSPEGPEQPPNYRPGGTTGRLPPNNRSPFCDRAVQGRYCTGCTGNYQKTGTTATTTGTTTGPFVVHLQKPAPDLLPVVPPPTTGTSTRHELPAIQPPPGPVQPACLRTVYWAEPVYPFALTYPFVTLDYIYSSTSS